MNKTRKVTLQRAKAGRAPRSAALRKTPQYAAARKAPPKARRADPTTVATVWHSMQTICREMRHVIDRTAQNFLISQLHDISVGLWDAKGTTIAVAVGLPPQFLGA